MVYIYIYSTYIIYAWTIMILKTRNAKNVQINKQLKSQILANLALKPQVFAPLPPFPPWPTCLKLFLRWVCTHDLFQGKKKKLITKPLYHKCNNNIHFANILTSINWIWMNADKCGWKYLLNVDECNGWWKMK